MVIHRNKPLAMLVALGLLAAAAACDSDSSNTPSGQPATDSAREPNPVSKGQPAFRADPECGTYDGQGCAPNGERIDLDRPTFSDPTEITNPLFPISELESVVLLGVVDDLPFRAETTLLPDTGTVLIDSEPVEVLLSQYTAYLDGRITEVALDRYAQADDGSVWYLGEDVYDYDNGTIVVTEGTWLAGRDGPPAMIMPGNPEVGQVFRAEDIPGIVFEQVTITEVDQTVDGPFGEVDGAVVAEELHLDGTTSEKVFAPGFGEFYTENEGEVEALSLAVPANRETTLEPLELAKVVTRAWGLVESARLEEWEAVDATLVQLQDHWASVSGDANPVRIADALEAALGTLTNTVNARDAVAASVAATEVAQSALDLELRYRSVAYVDIGRFHLHTQRLRIDAAAGDAAGVAGEVATVEWIRDRITGTLTAGELQRVDAPLAELRTTASTGNLTATGDQAARLANLIRTLSLP